MSWNIHTADVLDWAASYDGPKFHALLCDPPYHLTSVKRLSRSSVSQEPATLNDEKLKQSGAARFFKSQAGFMGKKWDGGDIAFRPETWAALAEHLHPGAFGMAFASSRGWHRLAVAIEDAGMIIQPSIFGWATGQSFPKATRIDTQIDKRAGKLGEREVVGEKLSPDGVPYSKLWGASSGKSGGIMGKSVTPNKDNSYVFRGATPLARAWAGHRYGGQVLKNALEPIIVFQKPWQGKRLDCIVETGAGAMWVDGGRIGTQDDLTRKGVQPLKALSREGQKQGYRPKDYYADDDEVMTWGSTNGRWPSNFTLTHSPRCQRVGTRRVKSRKNEMPELDEGRMDKSQWRFRPTPATSRGHADPDGYETVTAWDCVPECPVRRLGLRQVDNSVFLQYNKEKQEVNQCCESVSIAVVNLMLDHLMSSEGSGGFATENAVMPADGSVERLMPGDNKINVTGVGIGGGENLEVASYTVNLKADGSGKCQMDQSQKVVTSTTLTETIKTTICPICNSCLRLNIMLCTNVGEKTTELSRMERKQDAVNDAMSTNHSQVTLDVQRGHITAIVKIVGESIRGNGVKRTQHTTATISDAGGQNNVSRFYYQADWSYEIAERLATADPVKYQSKASRKERDAGLENMPLVSSLTEQIAEVRNQDRYSMSLFCKICGKRNDYGCGCNAGWEQKPQPGLKRKVRNPHPTIKPIALTRWLATLLLPPPEYAPRRLLIPFSGSGSEGIGAGLAGWEEMVLIDLLAENNEIAEARLTYWLDKCQLKLEL